MVNAAAENLMEYLMERGVEPGESSDAIFNEWAATWQSPLSINDYLEAKGIIRQYASRKVTSEMIRACFISIQQDRGQGAHA